ncbi:MAG: long-chain fatty acid--CoA ligase [Polyangiaceae bacterium]|nr:long-chain fatty acid--CoA ligase [Polyangiaceae bacterium]
MFDGTMMGFPLSIGHLLERGRAIFPDSEVVSRGPDKRTRSQTYEQTYARSEKLARALGRLGVRPGDRIATLSWNHAQHLECYLGIPAMGAVVHTLNIRLPPSELAYITNHAEDVAVVVDRTLLPLFEKFRSELKTVKHILVVRDDGGPIEPPFLDYDALVDAETACPRAVGFTPPEGPFAATVDENQAAMICYTSGTTGNPKGVAYSHRSTILHAMVGSMRDMMGIGCDDVVLPVVPMFHAAAWGLPYMAYLNGAKLVFPGCHLDPESLLDLMVSQRVTLAAGVPTIWNGILAKLDAEPKRWDLSSVRTMIIGGSAAPASMIEGFEKRHGLVVTHAWGMTETNPLGTLARVVQKVRVRGEEAILSARASQGIPAAFVETRHVDDSGQILPWDGAKMGELEVRGPWVTRSYVSGEGTDRFTEDGWFKTGDIVTIDAEGYVRITDRSKDVIKSGGEWISSVALENALMAHPAVLEAAVFAGQHPKWGERPIAAIVWKPGQTAPESELAAHLAERFPKYWLPDHYVVIDQIPRNSTGKFLKSKLRDQYGDVLVAK